MAEPSFKALPASSKAWLSEGYDQCDAMHVGERVCVCECGIKGETDDVYGRVCVFLIYLSALYYTIHHTTCFQRLMFISWIPQWCLYRRLFCCQWTTEAGKVEKTVQSSKHSALGEPETLCHLCQPEKHMQSFNFAVPLKCDVSGVKLLPWVTKPPCYLSSP